MPKGWRSFTSFASRVKTGYTDWRKTVKIPYHGPEGFVWSKILKDGAAEGANIVVDIVLIYGE